MGIFTPRHGIKKLKKRQAHGAHDAAYSAENNKENEEFQRGYDKDPVEVGSLASTLVPSVVFSEVRSVLSVRTDATIENSAQRITYQSERLWTPALRPSVVLNLPNFPTDSDPPDLTVREIDQTGYELASMGNGLLASLPANLWAKIAYFCSLADVANLALSCKTMRYRLGPEPWKALELQENRKQKMDVLLAMDKDLPNHLFCFLCTTYHCRNMPGGERLRPPNAMTVKPIFDCPNSRDRAPPRARLTADRLLPFSLAQLVVRTYHHSKEHGIHFNAVSRNWKCRFSGWSHSTRVHYHDGHLLLRCTSTHFTDAGLSPSEIRLLLYSRIDYAPYFSVCEHWDKTNLMSFCKCALSHVPCPREGLIEQARKAEHVPGGGISWSRRKASQFPKQCDKCRPLRRCPDCPTEYLVRVKLVEDADDPRRRFKHAIVITRWSDLGNAITPYTDEWSSLVGEKKDYNSFGAVRNATICSIMEMATNNGAPGYQAQPLLRGHHVY